MNFTPPSPSDVANAIAQGADDAADNTEQALETIIDVAAAASGADQAGSGGARHIAEMTETLTVMADVVDTCGEVLQRLVTDALEDGKRKRLDDGAKLDEQMAEARDRFDTAMTAALVELIIGIMAACPSAAAAVIEVLDGLIRMVGRAGRGASGGPDPQTVLVPVLWNFQFSFFPWSPRGPAGNADDSEVRRRLLHLKVLLRQLEWAPHPSPVHFGETARRLRKFHMLAGKLVFVAQRRGVDPSCFTALERMHGQFGIATVRFQEAHDIARGARLQAGFRR